jgi:hypothetical protein
LITKSHFFEADHAVFVDIGAHDGRIASIIGELVAVEDAVAVAITLFHAIFGAFENAFVETLFKRKIGV